jgi:hypothetical protein
MVDHRQKRDAHSSAVDASPGWNSYEFHPGARIDYDSVSRRLAWLPRASASLTGLLGGRPNEQCAMAGGRRRQRLVCPPGIEVSAEWVSLENPSRRV